MTDQSCSSPTPQPEKMTNQADSSLVEQAKCLMHSSTMLESLEATVGLLQSLSADPQTTELLTLTKYSLVKIILHQRLKELTLESLSLSAILHHRSWAEELSTLIEELSLTELDQPFIDPS